ncbi:uncharacterized protein LOC123037357 [Drosophila rhopaloa]|uniref:Integrase catalytic domain-containing protein n=1 Tax=Drosophila rhopaloa TaxID=1041015 RepID=A0ABM5J3M7_DRORH|nr:uncharacterized protein LOC123037357 [Drosophila rhopaloa]
MHANTVPQHLSVRGSQDLEFLLTTDQGRQFESKLFHELSRMLGIDHLRTTAYHPQANGIIERWHRTGKAAIMCKNCVNWPKKLSMILLGLRSAFKPVIQTTSAQLVYGTTLRLPGEFFHQESNIQPQTDFAKELEEIMREIRLIHTAHHDTSKPFVFKELEHATHVFLRNDTVRGSLQPPYDGPKIHTETPEPGVKTPRRPLRLTNLQDLVVQLDSLFVLEHEV